MNRNLCALATAAALCASAAQAQLTVAEMELLDEGFRIFTEETFDGNGRTCATCHVPEEQYSIAPSDIQRLTGKKLIEVMALNVPGLENPRLVRERALFNVEGGPHELGGPPAHDNALHCYFKECEGPLFRGSMSVAALALNTRGGFGPSPGTVVCGPGIANCAPNPALGWASNGSPHSGTHHGIADANADGSIRAFANGAIAQHNTTCLERTLGECFRLATDDELDALEAFQLWLGRREEFDIDDMTFSDARAEAGKAIFMSDEASCQTCHADGGANFGGFLNNAQHTDVIEERHRLSELTGVHIPKDPGLFTGPPGEVPDFGAFNVQPVIEAARKEAFMHNHAFVDKPDWRYGPIRHGFVYRSPYRLPAWARFTQFPRFGGFWLPGHRRGEDLTAIENGGDLEGVITFYFRDPFLSSSIAQPALLPGHSQSMEEFLAFTGEDGVEILGAFIRSLSMWYSLRDCERLVQETLDRIAAGVSPSLPALHCGFNLDDAHDILKDAKVPGLYDQVKWRALFLKWKVDWAAKVGNVDVLADVLTELGEMRTSVATTPDLP